MEGGSIPDKSKYRKKKSTEYGTSKKRKIKYDH